MQPVTPPSVVEAPAITETSSGLPKVLDISRYAALGKKSPFTLASTSEEAADFAKDLILTGYVRLDGEDFVMVANKTKPDRILVGKKPAPAAQGMILVRVDKDPSGDATKMRAQLKKGSETATLKYEATVGVGAPPAPSGMPVPQVPGTLGQAQGKGQIPGVQNPVIRRRVIPIPQIQKK